MEESNKNNKTLLKGLHWNTVAYDSTLYAYVHVLWSKKWNKTLYMKQFAEQVVEAGIVGDLHLMTVTALRLQLSEPRLHKTVVWDQNRSFSMENSPFIKLQSAIGNLGP